jgi:Fic family protein
LLKVDPARWDRVLEHSSELRGNRTGFAWLEGPLRASAYQSGAIEGMHPGDRGLTVTLMAAVADWEVSVRRSADGGGADVVDHIRAGVDALHLALDAATTATPISEAWIRQVHEVATAAQDTYWVNTPTGARQEHALSKGSYKQHDNHVLLADGSLLEFAPVHDVAPEMERLAQELQSEAFRVAHPAVQAAFAHHALTHIHPFADGNGRVARVVASVFLLRSVSLPLFLFADQKERYIDALSAADGGDIAMFVEFVVARVEDLAGLLVEQARAESLGRSSWRDDLDSAERFTDIVGRAVLKAQRRHRIRPAEPIVQEPDGDDPNVTWLTPGDVPRLRTTRWTIPIADGFDDIFEVVEAGFEFEENPTHPLVLRSRPSGLYFDARVDEVWPVESTSFELRLDAWLDQVVAELAVRLNQRLSGP